ncbi:IPO7 (predicted), partial [Pycnogonum litorale]
KGALHECHHVEFLEFVNTFVTPLLAKYFKMDSQKLVEFLRGTIDPNQRQQAEQQLEQIQKIIGFTPALLNVVMMNNLDMPVRQAGVIYFKNMILPYWEEKEAKRGEAVPFNIHEQDRAMIRDAIVDAVVHAPDCVRSQLAVCLSHIIKHDFPGRWTGLIDKISIYIQSPDRSGWLGSLICMYQLVFYYEFRDQSKRKPLNEALKLLLPLVFQRLAELLPDESEHSVLIQKTILKIFYSYVQYFLCLDIVTFEVFDQWMIVAKVIIQRPVPEVTNTIDEDERVDLVWWKCKKWAVRFVTRMFERYGSPGKVDKQYEEFSKHHLKTYVAPMLEIFLRILDDQRKKIYVSPRVLQLVMFYIKESVSHATAWKLVRPHILGIIQDVVFPLMCYQDEDEELWQTDPYEFIHMKFDLFSELTSPVTAAQKLIHQVAEKRKDMLQKIMMMVREVINSPEANPRHIDGALHIAGTVSDLM